MKRSADRSLSPERTLSPGYEARGEARQSPEQLERAPDVPEALLPEMEAMDTSMESQAVQDFALGYMPKPGEAASAVSEWCVEECLPDQFVHVANACGLDKVWVCTNASLVTECLPMCPSLREIVLSGDQISDSEAAVVLTALRANSTVEELFLSGCPQVSSDTLKLLAETLSVNFSLRHIGVSVARHPPDWIIDLAATLKARPYPLLALTLDDVGLKSEQLTALSCAILGNEKLGSLELLCISFANIEDPSVLTGIVKALPSLESLNLSGNDVGNVNAIVSWLGEGYQGKLQRLAMSDMRFGGPKAKTEWVESISTMLSSNTTLRVLDLRNNHLPGGPFVLDCSHLCAAIIANSALESLYLDGNDFTEATANRLIHALKRNLSLTKVTLSGGGVTQLQMTMIQQICAYNKSKQLTCTTALIEGAVANLAEKLGFPGDVGLRIGHFAAGKTPGQHQLSAPLACVDKAAYLAGEHRRSQAYGWMLAGLMKEPDGFDEIEELCRALQEAGVAILSDHMDDLVQAAANADRLKELIASIERSGFAGRPSSNVLALLLADAQSKNQPGLVKALQRFGAS